ncbi:MAG: hypothetical protein IJW40_11115 [Clostridia bacterium]|nr:hypothetical protein [Clostridia bacterium]
MAMVLVLCGWVFRRKKTIDGKVFLFLFIVVLESFYNSAETLNILAALLFAICGSDDVKAEEKALFYVSVLITSLFFVFLFLGMVESRTYISTTGRIRTTMGFDNPNVAALFFSSALYLFVLCREKIKNRHLVVAAVLELVVFYFTDSRASFFAFLCFVVLVYIMRLSIFQKKNSVLIYASDAFFVIHLLSMFFAEYLMPLNSLLSGRIMHFINMTNEAGLMRYLFGGSPLRSDNFFYMLMFKYGIFIYGLFALMVHFAMERLIKKKYYAEAAFIFAHLLLGFMESSIIRPEIASVMMVWVLIFSNTKRNGEINQSVLGTV